MVVVYSTEWTGDLVIGKTIINILRDELEKRGIKYSVTESLSLSDDLDMIPWAVGPQDKVISLEVEDNFQQDAAEALDNVYKDVKRLRVEVEKVARDFIRDESELREYLEEVGEVYGWW